MDENSILIVGSIALDTIKTPFGEKKEILGGSAVYAGLSASFYKKNVNLLGVVGSDFPQKHIKFLESYGINTEGIEKQQGKTFRWDGYYEYDMNQAHTVKTKLNVLATFNPKLLPRHKACKYVFLANFDPDLQLEVLSQLKDPKIVAVDTMDYWIKNKRKSLHKIVKAADVILMNDSEIRQFMETPNIPIAARRLIELGAKSVIVKKGEHGALFFTESTHFSAPSYPQEFFRDPTGAGDSFAGGFIGYLAKTGDLSQENFKKSIIIGSVMASFNVEDFSVERLKTLKHKEIVKRFEMIRRFSEFEPLSISNWM